MGVTRTNANLLTNHLVVEHIGGETRVGNAHDLKGLLQDVRWFYRLRAATRIRMERP